MIISKQLLAAAVICLSMSSAIKTYDASELQNEVARILSYVEHHGFNTRAERFVGSWLMHKINSPKTTDYEIITLYKFIQSEMSLKEINTILYAMAKEERRV